MPKMWKNALVRLVIGGVILFKSCKMNQNRQLFLHARMISACVVCAQVPGVGTRTRRAPARPVLRLIPVSARAYTDVHAQHCCGSTKRCFWVCTYTVNAVLSPKTMVMQLFVGASAALTLVVTASQVLMVNFPRPRPKPETGKQQCRSQMHVYFLCSCHRHHSLACENLGAELHKSYVLALQEFSRRDLRVS